MRRASRGRLERPLSLTEVAGSGVEVGVLWGWEGGVSLLGRGSAGEPSDITPFGWAIVELCLGFTNCLEFKLNSSEDENLFSEGCSRL